MKVGITTFGADGGASGIGRYVREMIRWLPRVAPDLELEVISHPREASVFVEAGSQAKVLELSAPTAPLPNLVWHLTRLPGVARRRGYDVLFLPAGNRRLPLTAPCPTVGTVHDLASLHLQDKYDRARALYGRKVLPALIRRLDGIITVSGSAKGDILRATGVPQERIRVVHNGVDLSAFGPEKGSEAETEAQGFLDLNAPYFLYVARIEHPGKNHIRLIDAFNTFKSRWGLPHELVLAGPHKERSGEVLEAAARSPWAEQIHFPGFVPDSALPRLYRDAEALLFPSLHEGFGIPLLEAMASGTPVLSSDRSSLPEVAGDAAVLLDPMDTEGWAQWMHRIIWDEDLRHSLVRAGLARAPSFSWEASARQTAEVLRKEARVAV